MRKIPTLSRKEREAGIRHPVCRQPSLVLVGCGFQIGGGLVDSGRDVVDHLGDHGNLRVGFLPFFLIHIFTDCRDWFGAVSRVGAGRVDLVLEPRTLGQSFLVEEQARDAEQVRVDGIEGS